MPSANSPENTRLRCRHILTSGNRCGSPCLRDELFCYYHHTTRIPITEPKARLTRASLLFLPNPEDRASIQTAVSQVMHAIAHNNVDLKRAGLLLYSLQIATSALPRTPAQPPPRPASPPKIPSPPKAPSKRSSSTTPTASSPNRHPTVSLPPRKKPVAGRRRKTSHATKSPSPR